MKQVRWNPSPEPAGSVHERLTVIEADLSGCGDTAATTPTDELWLGIYLPFLALESLHETSLQKPIAVFEHHKQGQRIVIANRTAQKNGVRAGMSLTAARTLDPGLSALFRNQSLERGRLRQLAAAAGRWTPDITLLDDGLLLNISGSTRLFGGIDQLVERIQRWICAESMDPCISLMPTAASARLCARARKASRVTSRQNILPVVRSLSASALITDIKNQRLLMQLGTRTVGDLLRLPRDGLARRFGPDLLIQLDRLLGHFPDPQVVFKPMLRFRKVCALDAEVIDIALLYPAVRHLLKTLSAYLSAHHIMVEKLQWRLTGERGACYRLPVHLAKPHRDIDELDRLSQLTLESLKINDPIVRLELYANRFTPWAPINKALFDATNTGCTNGHSLLERLQTRLGRHAVHGIQAQTDHRPENAWRRCKPGEIGSLCAGRNRPLWLLPSPKPIHMRDGQLRVGHQHLFIGGPCERICSGWWDSQPIRRDYYQASIGSLRAWVFRDLDSGCWHLHGIF